MDQKSVMKAFRGRRLRHTMRQGEPIFCLVDLGSILQLPLVDEVESWLDPDELCIAVFPNEQGQDEGLQGVTLDGLWTLVERSDVSFAREFRRWVNHEILTPLFRSSNSAAFAIDSPMSNWQVQTQKAHQNEAQQIIADLLGTAFIARYFWDRCKGITGNSTEFYRRKGEDFERATGIRLPVEIKGNATAIVRLFEEVSSVLFGISDDIIGFGVLDVDRPKPWQRAIGLAKKFEEPMQALYDNGVRVIYEPGSELEDTKRAIAAAMPPEPVVQAPRLYSQFYVTYIASPEWASKRRQALERAGFVCECCQLRRATEVHHLTYERIPDEPLDALLALCADCQRVADERRRFRYEGYGADCRAMRGALMGTIGKPGDRARRLLVSSTAGSINRTTRDRLVAALKPVRPGRRKVWRSGRGRA